MNGKNCELMTLSLLCFALAVDGFTAPFGPVSAGVPSTRTFNQEIGVLMAGKKKRRRRKQPPGTAIPEPEHAVAPEAASPPVAPEAVAVAQAFETAEDINPEDVDVDQLADIANFKFEGSDQMAPPQDTVQSIPLPDIKEVLRKKAREQLAKQEEEEKWENKVKINRKDKDAFAKLLEQQPYADADDSYFEEEEYNLVSALLGERAEPFLGIPTGPLQVGHTLGALVIVLMSFVSYPGFPLTNLPTVLRSTLQGGLGTVYSINVILAILAAFKAGERGQPALLWIAKTFTVGGLAYDQLTQLPTLEQIESTKNRKGKRALKNKRN